jgi:3-methyl-2-oxobutanoate hydroxymethyltransferase
MTRVKALTIDQLNAISVAAKIAMLTCYDATFARAMDRAGIDIIPVGDRWHGRAGTRDYCRRAGRRSGYPRPCVARGRERSFARRPAVRQLPRLGHDGQRRCADERRGAMVKLEGGR